MYKWSDRTLNIFFGLLIVVGLYFFLEGLMFLHPLSIIVGTLDILLAIITMVLDKQTKLEKIITEAVEMSKGNSRTKQ